MGIRKAGCWKKGVLCALVFIAGCTGLRMGCALTSLQTEEEWYAEKAKYLSTIEITPEMIAQGCQWEGGFCALRCPDRGRREGCIRIGPDDGVYVVCHSSHAYEYPPYLLLAVLGWRPSKEHPPVRDAMLAVDRDGNLYKNGGHICCSSILSSAKEVLTLGDFLETISATDKEKWEVYEPGER